MNKDFLGRKFLGIFFLNPFFVKLNLVKNCFFFVNYHIGRKVGRFQLSYDTLKVTFSQRSKIDQPTNQSTNQPTKDLRKIAVVGKNKHHTTGYCNLTTELA